MRRPRKDIFLSPRGPLVPRCAFCWESGATFTKCSGCDAVLYCSTRHWLQHRTEHESLCDDIKQGRTWETQPECDLTDPRSELASALQRTGSREGIYEALEHMLAMSGDRLCAIYRIQACRMPTIMLQLDRDQECHDFIQRWRSIYGVDNPADLWFRKFGTPIPPLPQPNADVMAPGSIHDEATDHLMIATVLLLKMKLMVDVIRLKITLKAISARLPPELLAHVGKCVVRSSISPQWVGLSYGALTAVQQGLEKQIPRLGRIVQWSDTDFFGRLLNLESYQVHASDKVRHRMENKPVAYLDFGFAVWWEHEGVIELLQSARSLAVSDEEEDIGVNSADITARPQPFKEKGFSTRYWDYFTSAVEDALSLGESKPSDIRKARRRAAAALTGHSAKQQPSGKAS